MVPPPPPIPPAHGNIIYQSLYQDFPQNFAKYVIKTLGNFMKRRKIARFKNYIKPAVKTKREYHTKYSNSFHKR